MFQFTLDTVQVLQFLVAVVLPVLVGIVTKRTTSPRVKAFLLALLSLVTSLVAEAADTLANGGVYDVGQGLVLFVPTFVVAIAIHYGFWKPTGTSDAVAQVGNTYHNEKTITPDA